MKSRERKRDKLITSQFLPLTSVTLHLKTAGAGEPCLLLHGYPQTWFTYRHCLKALAPSFRAYAPDFRGWGESEKKPPFTLSTMVSDTVELMQKLGHKRYSIIGHDWGASVAYLIACRYPESIRKMITVNMPVHRFDFTKTLHFYFFNLPWLPEQVMRRRSDAVVQFIINWWAYNKKAFPPSVLEVYQKAARQPGANEATLSYYRNTSRQLLDFRNRELPLGPFRKPPKPSVPWLVLWGTHDAVSPLRNARLFKEDMPGVPVQLIQRAGHFPQEEQPKLFIRHMLDFLKRKSP